MPSESDPAHRALRNLPCHCQNDRTPRPRWIRSWTVVGTVVSGVLALLWFVLRSGAKPSRLAYPCQQAAIGTAAAAFGVPFVASIMALRGRLFAALRTGSGKMAAAGLAVLGTVWVAVAAADRDPNITISAPPPGYEPDVFLVNDARGLEPGRFGGVDDLVSLMGQSGLKLHRSTASGPTWGPDGLIDADDVVLIKINAQWPQRGGTNTDVLRGVIRRVVEHPDGFVGEVIVADNGQGLGDLDRAENNAEDHGQSTQNVVNDFAAEGWQVSTKRWDAIGSASVAEYDVGDYAEGYVVNPTKDPITRIYVSYPKFQSSHGTYISYKYGVWSPSSEIFDPDRLVVINIPVFKTHGSYAITASVKNHMGVVTTASGTGAHTSVLYGGMGSVLSEVRMPDLNILDCIWILARPGAGPSAAYASATRRDQLVASTDPIALDVWATKYIMIPQIIDNGYDYADYQNWQDPDNPNSRFRTYLDRSMTEMLDAGIDTTNDYNSVRLHVWAEVIPTVSAWGAIILGMLLLTAGSLVIRKRHPAGMAQTLGGYEQARCSIVLPDRSPPGPADDGVVLLPVTRRHVLNIRRIVGGTLVLVCLGVNVLAVIFVTLEHKLTEETITDTMSDHGGAWARLCGFEMQQGDTTGLQSVIDAIGRSSGVRLAMVVSESGRIGPNRTVCHEHQHHSNGVAMLAPAFVPSRGY